MMNSDYPTVLTISGHDPTGGAGIQADIETITSLGCHACSIITALTVQDTRNVSKIIPQSPKDLSDQFHRLAADIQIDVIKIGLLGSLDAAIAVHDILSENNDLTVVLDPVLAAGDGSQLSDKELIDAIKSLLIPATTVLTPNSLEAHRLIPNAVDLRDCGLSLLLLGCDYVLITGAHENSLMVTNTLFGDSQTLGSLSWERLPYSYHGSGCTLAASIAAMIAQGLTPTAAVKNAQEFTWNALKSGFKPGKGQYIPNRLFRIR